MSFTKELTKAVSTVAPSVVRVRAEGRRRRYVSSGIAWSADRVIAAAHAVPREGTVELRLDDGTEREAEVLARDGILGIALLRADGAGLTRPAFRDPGDLAVGEPVLALGRPGRSVRASFRIVGALGDDVTLHGGARLDRYIESDRGFPRGFEGGPLIDLGGRVVGMNTAAVLRGADLAIPEPTLRAVTDALEQHGGVRRGYLGVSVQSVRVPAATGTDTGVIVLELADGGPAAGAGILLGDVILSVDGSPTGSPMALSALLADKADAGVSLRVLRAGATIDLSATAGSRVR